MQFSTWILLTRASESFKLKLDLCVYCTAQMPECNVQGLQSQTYSYNSNANAATSDSVQQNLLVMYARPDIHQLS